jgi:hypothetical protein
MKLLTLCLALALSACASVPNERGTKLLNACDASPAARNATLTLPNPHGFLRQKHTIPNEVPVTVEITYTASPHSVVVTCEFDRNDTLLSVKAAR